MKAIVLAGGFGKRLWPLTKDKPKPLISVGGRPIIEYILDGLAVIEDLDKVFISVNSRFEPHFRAWADGVKFSKEIEIVPEPTTCEEDKIGAVGALSFLIRQKGIEDDLIVIAGDNLFDFDVRKFLCARKQGSPLVALYDMKDKDEVRRKYGVVKLDRSSVISDFKEKPDEPESTLISTGCYFFPSKAAAMIHTYLREGNNPDAPGFFISWLSRQMAVQGFVFDGSCRWFDIGSIESLQKANEAYSGKG